MRRIVLGTVAGTALLAVPLAVAGTSAGAAPAARCTVSHAVPARHAVHGLAHMSGYRRFVEFTTVQRGTWAGFVSGGYDRKSGDHGFEVVSYRPGHHVRVLMRGHVSNDVYEPAGLARAAGVTAHGTVIATVQNDRNKTNSGEFGSDVWAARAAHRARKLHAPHSWWSVQATSVTDSGRIIGLGLSGSYRHPTVHPVTWSGTRSRPHRIPGVRGDGALYMRSDQNGDIGWQGSDGRGRVRLRNGSIRVLADPGNTDTAPGDGMAPVVGAGHFLWGNNGFRGLLRWNLANPPAHGPIYATVVRTGSGAHVVDAGSRTGTTIQGDRHRVAVFGDGQRHAVPSVYRQTGDHAEAVDRHNTVSFTSGRDGLPHFLRCT